ADHLTADLVGLQRLRQIAQGSEGGVSAGVGHAPRVRGDEAQALSGLVGVKVTGMCFRPLMKLERRRSTLPETLMSGRRRRSSSNMARIWRRARLAPRQKWGPPPPKATCSLGVRPTSKR